MFAAFVLLCASLQVSACKAAAAERGGELELTRAVVVVLKDITKQEQKAIEMLVDETQKRSRIRWKVSNSWPADANTPVIAVGAASAFQGLAGPLETAVAAKRKATQPEGFTICVESHNRKSPAVFVVGNDARGVLFGVGRLLRELRFAKNQIRLAADLQVSTAPRVALRGHQLGYRPKTNSYDGWTVAMWEQYYRDLVVFGTNAVELIPPRSDDAADSPHFPLLPMEMMVEMSRLADDYAMDVWIWYPAMDNDYSDPKTVEFALGEWADVFRRLPRVDAVFVPSGDPGHARPKDLLALLEKQTANLHRFHPKAKMWLSVQSFTAEWMTEMLDLLKAQPKWLTGIVYGPQTRMTLDQARREIPKQYPIRLYPDITHSLRCQYPVADWDVAFAQTQAREVINPRPLAQQAIFKSSIQPSIGFITYSEGCNDDVNKFIWSALGWDPDRNVSDIVHDYSKHFIGDHFASAFAKGLLGLEQDWAGPLRKNRSVEATFASFRAMEKTARPADWVNWRFQQALYRAYYDVYVQRRLLHETELEMQALEKLRQAPRLSAMLAMLQSEEILDRAKTHPVAQELRARVFELAEALFQSIRMQLSVERYQAIDVGRGANLDLIDMPLNNRVWLRRKFDAIRRLDDEPARLKELNAIVHWTDPGPGGYYDDLGDPANQPHLVGRLPYRDDPGFMASPVLGFRFEPTWRLSWCTHADALYDTKLQLRYDRLDRTAHYAVRVVYSLDGYMQPQVRLVANDGIEIHPLMAKPTPIGPVEFAIPPAATAGGTLTLTFSATPGRGGAGRGCQVAEVWLIRKPRE